MAKFKVGDRVRLVVRDDALPVGSVGTVLEDDSTAPYVSWDGYTDGHDGGGLTNDESVRSAYEECLELIEPAPPATRDPIAILVACGIITQAQADAARALVQS